MPAAGIGAASRTRGALAPIRSQETSGSAATAAPCGCSTHSRRERTAAVQQLSRTNGARYEATTNLDDRDSQMRDQVLDRAWIWNYDAEAEAAEAVVAH